MKRAFIFFGAFFFCACTSVNASSNYFTRDFLAKAIGNPSLRYEVAARDIIFDTTRAEGLRIYGGVIITETMSSDTVNMLAMNSIEYMNYNVILLVERIDGISYVRDFVIIEKLHPETHLASGPVEINGEYFDWETLVVVNRDWTRRPYTDDISQAFRVNVSTRRIEPYLFRTIRLFSEV